MTKFTKEQLIERAKQNIRASGSFPGDRVAAIDLRLAEIALAALTAAPEAYVAGGYGLLHYQNPKLDEYIKNATPLYRLPLLEGLK